MRLGRFVLFLLAFLAAEPLPARDFVPPVPQDWEQVDVYLHTVEVDDLVFNNFGHTAIRVVDPSNNLDVVYNWGLFDFRDPLSFSFQFFKGILNYKLGIFPYRTAYRAYQFEQRTVWEDHLDLTITEKQRLLDRLIWNARPENREYSYQYFFDNCSTRPRDYINEALDGGLREAHKGELTGQSFREMVWSHYATNPEVAVSLDITMNSRIDREMRFWEKMFLPKVLREGVLRYQTAGGPLVDHSKVLMEFPVPEPYPLHGYWLMLMGFAVPLALVFAHAFIRWREKRLPFLAGAGLRAFGVVAIVYGIYTGLLGIIMPVAWMFSEHLDLHHNANMWAFWPLDLVLVYWGWKWLRTGKAMRHNRRADVFWRRYTQAHLAALLIFGGLWLFGILKQDVSRVVQFMVPLSILIWAGYLWGQREGTFANEDQL